MKRLPKYKVKANRIAARKIKYVIPANPILKTAYNFIMMLDYQIRYIHQWKQKYH